ncbi:MAG: ATP-binding protein [Planctomycetota bacterium]
MPLSFSSIQRLKRYLPGFTQSLRVQVSLMILGVALPLMLVAFLIPLAMEISTVRDREKTLLTLHGRLLEGQARLWIRHIDQALTEFAHQPDIRSLDPRLQQRAIDRFASRYPDFYLVYTTDPAGTITARSGLEPTPGHGAHDYFQRIMAGETLVRQPILSNTLGRPALVTAAPILGPHGQPAGMVSVGFDFQHLQSIDISPEAHADSRPLLIGPNGHVLFGPAAYRGKAVHDVPELAHLLTADRPAGGAVTQTQPPGHDPVIHYVKAMSNGWTVATVAKPTFMDDRAVRASWITLLVGGSALSLVTVAVWFITGRALGPVRQMTAAAQRLGESDLRIHHLEEPHNELGTLTRAFKAMARRLRDTIEQFELRVTVRTAELEAAHDNERRLRVRLDQEHARLEALLATIPQGVFWKDRDTAVIGCNDALAQIVGLEDADQLLGKPEPASDQRADPVLPVSLHPGGDDDRAVLETGQPLLDYEEPFVRADGQTRTLLTSKVPFRDAHGEIIGILGSTVDITATKQREKLSAHAQKMESIGELAAGIAHEINTPTQFVAENTRFLAEAIDKLTAIISAYEALTRADAPLAEWANQVAAIEKSKRDIDFAFVTEEAPMAVRESLEGVDRIRDIVQAMREFSHPGEAAPRAFDLNHVVRSSATVCRNRWKYVADLGLDLADDLPTVHGHAGELGQALVNLIVNAADAVAHKYPPQTSGLLPGIIRIATRRVDECVQIEVSDNGDGVPEHLIQRIFEPFFTTKGVGQGTGQGLAITHKVIVNHHRGNIETLTTPGGGATFRLSLPVTANRPLTADAA